MTDSRHSKLDTELTHAGDFLGLSAAEYFGASVLGSVFVGSVALAAARLFGVPLPWLATLVGIVVGYAAPRAIVDSARVARFVAIGRGLPSAIDLMSLSMSAGLDFPGALSQVVEKSKANEALRSELAYVLQQLRLGTTRAAALRGFAERVPLESVRELTQALLQADERGNPVAAVIEVQASTARTRRSNLAEKAADDMRSKMILPVMMIVGVNLTLIAVPSSMMIESFAK
jgi:tight adherence protein C